MLIIELLGVIVDLGGVFVGYLLWWFILLKLLHIF
jgi:hypothetical protein